MKNCKKIIITESQFILLLLRKKREHDTVKSILEEINKINSTLNESVMINEGIVDTLRKYSQKGLLTVGVISSLLASPNISAAELTAAGVDQNKIEQAGGGGPETGGDDLTKLDQKLQNHLKRTAPGTLQQYQQLPSDQKQLALQDIQKRIGGDLNKVSQIQRFTFSGDKPIGGDVTDISTQGGEEIVVDTVRAAMVTPLFELFEHNSWKLINPQEARRRIQNALNSFTVVDSIIIRTSSSTLRNKGAAENMTWLKLSEQRANTIAKLLEGMEYNLGGCDLNPSQQVDTSKVRLKFKGKNGDGTSGPPSPYEQNPEKYGYDKISPKFWKSAGQGKPYTDLELYKKGNNGNFEAYGRAIETRTDKIINFQFINFSQKYSKEHKMKIVKGNRVPTKVWGSTNCLAKGYKPPKN